MLHAAHDFCLTRFTLCEIYILCYLLKIQNSEIFIMRIAIIHYHLRPGGVTKVIQNTLKALEKSSLQFIVFTSESPSPTMPVPNHAIVEALEYMQPSKTYPSARDVLKELHQKARNVLGGLPDVWHIHNHALGKNVILPELSALLAQEGQLLLLQPHDFAEDGRPENYSLLREHFGSAQLLGMQLYPQGHHIHYALLNQRDLRFLQAAGACREQLHYLPNAIATENLSPGDLPQRQNISEKLYLYPGRAIRRKNIGEFLLWAALAESENLFALTLAPQNPLAKPIYEQWVAFAQSLNLPVKFDFADQWQGDFNSLFASAHALVSTSVAEGFGLAFLEPWLAGRPLLGRNLPEVTTAIEEAGVNLSALYARLDVPLAWVGKDQFIQEITLSVKHVYQAYGRTASNDDIERAVAEAIHDKSVDFGKLNESLQQFVIQYLVNAPAARQEIQPPTLCVSEPDPAMIRQNRQAVLEHFNLDIYGKRLMQLYQTVADSEPETLNDINADALLTQFLAPERFCLLRT
ncbi:group 1 glycosyl transferase [Candidatus Vecturithrix granuli]|uniref:Group 1 glycosyl transferase n=1 Tax=Vecturithrix granuli TaxID=1499967 RepID=A0A081BYJ2_VECG1|nr:group 1 glycosyl transferase [Candidatus Vecturithrix granuli]